MRFYNSRWHFHGKVCTTPHGLENRFVRACISYCQPGKEGYI